MIHKKILIVVMLILGIGLTSLQAQKRALLVREINNSFKTFNLSDIRKITFPGEQMQVETQNGNDETYQLEEIRYLDFYWSHALSTPSQTLIPGGMTLYPNPVKDALTISFESSESREFQIEIIDLQGRQITQLREPYQRGTNQTIIDVSGLTRGIYLCRLTYNNKVETKKFIKE